VLAAWPFAAPQCRRAGLPGAGLRDPVEHRLRLHNDDGLLITAAGAARTVI